LQQAKSCRHFKEWNVEALKMKKEKGKKREGKLYK
jgi:hypothetical protein